METKEQTVTVSPESAPWRRFFARSLDYFIYELLWGMFLCLVLNVNWVDRSAGGEILDVIMSMVLMLVIEPALLALFGTTIGKWILGLHITDRNGERLFYGEAFSRTWMVLCCGYGLCIPIYNLIRLWKSYSQCKEGDSLDWEYESKVILRDRKKWRILLYTGAYVILGGVLFLIVSMAQMPKYRGDITAEQFCENYNQLAKFYGYELGLDIDESGKMGEEDDGTIKIGVPEEGLDYTYTEENGVMTGMGFTQSVKESDAWIPSYQEEMILCIKSFVEAQKGCSLFASDMNTMIDKVSESLFQSFEFRAYGITIACKVEYVGYIADEELGGLFPDEGKKNQYSLSFTMEKEQE